MNTKLEIMVTGYHNQLDELVKAAQNSALNMVFEKLMNHNAMIEQVLYNKTGSEIINASLGNKFTQLNHKWIELLKKSRYYTDIACMILDLKSQL